MPGNTNLSLLKCVELVFSRDAQSDSAQTDIKERAILALVAFTQTQAHKLYTEEEDFREKKEDS